LALKPSVPALPNPLRGEVWLVDFDPSLGAEIQKARPAVVLSRDDVGVLPLRLVVPFTTWQAQFAGAPWLVPIHPTPGNGLTRQSAADAFQTSSFWTGRFVKRLGTLDSAEVEKIAGAISASVTTS
jgi:mRNA interferase MazF